MGFFKARYVRDYVAAAKLKAAVIWAAEIAAVLILGIVLAVGYGKITVMQEGSMDPTLNAGYKSCIPSVFRMIFRYFGFDYFWILVNASSAVRISLSSPLMEIASLAAYFPISSATED